MSEISPPTRPLAVHELYPAVRTSETRERYAASEAENAEEAAKAKQAYQGNESHSREANSEQYVEENGKVVGYEMKNGNMQTSTSDSSSNSTESWTA